MICNKPVAVWINLFNSCFNLTQNGFQQWCWPDGKPVLEQSNLVFEMFTLIKSESETQFSKKMAK